jgi:hypothetical protein
MTGEKSHSVAHEPSQRARPVAVPTQTLRGRKIMRLAGTKSAVAAIIHHDGESLSW